MPNTATPTVGSKSVRAKKVLAPKLTSKSRVKPSDKPLVGPKKAVLVVGTSLADSMKKAEVAFKAAEIKSAPPTQLQRDTATANAINNVAARNAKAYRAAEQIVFTASNPNVKRDQSTAEVVKNALDYKVGRKVKVLKIVDRRGNVECILKGRIKSMTTVGAYVSDFEKPNGRPEWFPFKSKMQWIVLG